jgi:glycosyltransferase involved in cell wall biosynthesis
MRIPNSVTPASRPFKILMRNRPDAVSHPGGDTVLMENLAGQLRLRGHTVQIDLECGADAAAFDIIHLFNLTLPELIAASAREAIGKGIPFLVHALHEDWPRFRNRCLATAVILEKYVAAGQPRGRLDATLALLGECPAADMPICPEASMAAAILCTGGEETATLLRHYPAARTRIVPLAAGSATGLERKGKDEGGLSADAEADFRKTFGLGDFVLCVGRLEPRKNQLMLLAALEESDLTVVFADGGFSYAPEYTAACRKFSRRGRTVFTGRLTPALLQSAYRNARVSCLPSWYELPGLATLESALWGRQVVTCPYGTIGDYLGSSALYAEPDDPQGLGVRILESWDRTPDFSLRQRASEFTWARTARETEKVYLEIAEMRR